MHHGTLPAAVSSAVGHGAPIAIWLGLLLDGIPESLVIGATAGAIRVSFIAGIALSNYPEALASSVGMREQSIDGELVTVDEVEHARREPGLLCQLGDEHRC